MTGRGRPRRERVTVEDLEWAATWLEAYEDEDGVPAERSTSDDEFVRTAQRVAAYLRAEVARREDVAVVARVRRARPDLPAERVRAVVRRQRANVEGRTS